MVISTNQESVDKYNMYIKNHVNKVISGFQVYGEELCESCGADYATVRRNICMHDDSKHNDEEFYAYMNKFYPSREYTEEERAKVETEFNRAWLFHIHNNPHHPEYWIIPKNDGNTVVKMPPEYIVEMILDWDSFRQDDGTGGAYSYYYTKDNKEGLLHPNTRELLEKSLEIVK